MSQPYLIFDSSGAYAERGICFDAPPPGEDAVVLPAGAVACTQDQFDAAGSWTTFADGAIVIGTPPGPSLSDQAIQMLAAGCTIASTATPALNGTYACDGPARAEMSEMYDLIQRAGGAFPGGLTALPWPDISNDPTKVRVFPSVTDFLNFESAVGTFVLTCKMIVTTGAGTLPTLPVTIA